MDVYNMNPSAIYAGLKAEITAEVNKLMPKAGGSFTGVTKAMASPTDANPQLRNIVVVDAGTDLASLTVPVGTIILEKKL